MYKRQVENEDYSGNPLSAAQVEANARLYARGVREYGWPLQSTDSPSGRGLGWHGMGGAAWGGHYDCPGQPIKDQRPAILARAAELLGKTPPTVEDDMPYLATGPSGTIYLVPGDLVDSRMVAIPQSGAQLAKLQSMVANGVRSAPKSTIEPRTPLWFITVTDALWPPPEPPVEVELSDEDLADLAEQVAELLPKPLTYDETVQASEEGAENASDR